MHIQILDTLIASDGHHSEYIHNLSLREKRHFHVATFIHSPQVHAYDHGNTQTTLSFSVTRQHGSVQNAKDFLLSHNATLQGLQGHAQIIENESVHYLHNAIITQVDGSLEDVSTTHTYTLIGGIFSEEPPF